MKVMSRVMMLVPVLLATGAGGVAGQDWVATYEGLLQKYVGGGGVRYQAWHGNKADLAALGAVVAAVGNENVSGWPKDERLAFYLNSYNAWILKEILDDYPTDGPGGGGFFGRNRFFKSESIKVAGKVTSFTGLENDVIRAGFKEPRIHFALNCASASCPPLHARAFRAGTLDATLDLLARAFLDGDVDGVTVKGGVAYVSKIFDWFAEDFGGEKGVKAYIDGFRREPLPAKVKYLAYRWKLNETK